MTLPSLAPFVPAFGLLCALLLAAPAPPGAEGATRSGGLRPTSLRCEYAVDPLGLDTPRPRLSWTLQAARADLRGLRQSAYQVLVASSRESLTRGRPDLWDSGRVASAESLGIGYGGRPLRSGERVYWKVRAWDGRGRSSPYSETAAWEMALLEEDAWQASWIATGAPPPVAERERFGDRPAPLFRKEFRLEGRPVRARAYVTGLGYYELRLNGRRVGDHLLDPAWTDYSKRVLYSTYDVTPLLQEGPNAVGLLVGDGWWNPLPLRLFNRFNFRDHLPVGEPRALAQLEVTLANGSTRRVVTDGSWKWSESPLLRNSVYLGELYDARKEQPGWDLPGFDESGWRPVVRPRGAVGPLQAQNLPPIRATRRLQPREVTGPGPGVKLYDLGQNFAGWVLVQARGAAGTRVTLRYGELLAPDGTLNPMTSVAGQIKRSRVNAELGGPETAYQTDAFILKGVGTESWTPRFCFRGFRYVEVTSAPGPVEIVSLEGRLLNSDVESAGSFSCSNPMLTRLQDVVRWTQLSNMFSVQSDCPHREKLGYGGDIVAASEMAIFNFDMARFYAKTVRDFADAARPNGGFTETAPFVGIADESLGEGSGPVGWGTAHPLLLAQLYQYYGDRRLLEEQYGAAARWLELLQARAVQHILDNGISDHESLVPRPRALTGTAFYYYNARILARLAKVLGKEEDAARYERLAAEIRGAFNRRFLEPGTGKYDTGSQACQAFALFMELVPAAEQGPAQKLLTDDILETRKGHLSTGIFGTKYLLSTLTDGGRADVAYTVVNQKEFPGWGHMLEKGATTLWEHWAYSDNTYSHNHPMFGSVSEWFFRGLGGINPDPEAAGFDRFYLRPHPVGDLEWVKCRYDSARGPVVSEWSREEDRLRWTVEVPPNTTAVVFVPAPPGSRVTEGGRPADRARGVRFLFQAPDSAVYELGSGRYVFTAER